MPRMQNVTHMQQLAPGQLPPDALSHKSNKWRSLQNRRYGEKRKAGFIDTGKVDLPPEHVRKILKARVLVAQRNDLGAYPHGNF